MKILRYISLQMVEIHGNTLLILMTVDIHLMVDIYTLLYSISIIAHYTLLLEKLILFLNLLMVEILG